MKIGKAIILILCLTTVFLACNKDDGGTSAVVVEDRDRGEQQIIDNDSILGYLETHYYNASAFVSNPDPSLADLVISLLPDDGILPDSDNNTLLIDAVETKTYEYEDTLYEYYILRLNQGGGIASPNFSDDIRTNYIGSLLDDDVFDSAVNPIDLDLTSLILGWRRVFPEFNVAASFVENGDGTVGYMNYGLGVMFLPSGIGYFSAPQGGIPAYSPLIFKFELFDTEINDHDGDTVPSYLEDLDGDGEFTVDGDDTDGDLIPDYFDIDDDGDGVVTLNEDIDGDGDPTNDIGANGIAKYLDPLETESKED